MALAMAMARTTTPSVDRCVKKGQIVRGDKEKYLNSINYLSVGHPVFYKGLGYIYDDRGEVSPSILSSQVSVLFAISWMLIPTAPAWLPTEMLIKVLPLLLELQLKSCCDLVLITVLTLN
ncbi:hypothetical protein MLD38_021470 [Melastoma candidum]|uniref:Uncharacterized protein n=1 Tax=Melastoma candidum TaxID=119954 RepID=A0ACB9QGF0_9MYRT|nr:hypothetical protein MLD38_021470 [Melastoma candidum]